MTCIFDIQAAPTHWDLPPLADTVRISVAVLQPKDTCLSSLIGMGRTITSLNACQTSSRHVRLTAQSADCIRLTAISTTAGSQDTLCIQHCNRNGTDCRTSVLIAQVAGGTLGCDIAPDTLVRVQLPDCQGRARFCISGSNILDEFRRNYTITHNGSPYNGLLEGCSFDTIYSYTYFTIPGSFQQPPYRLDGWMFNGRNYQMDSINSIFTLVDSMNQWDPRSLWTLDTASLAIVGGYPGNAGMYGEMRITKLSNGTSGVMRVNTSQISNGVSLSFAAGQHTIVFQNNILNCSDTLRMGVGCPGLLPIAVDDSVSTQRNTPITFNLLSNDMLNGTLARPPGVITLSTTGTITISLTPTSANVTYLPRAGFCGTEVFEYQICNDEGCDTAKVTINVVCDSTVNRKPIANDDIAQTRQNNSLIINAILNDSLYGTLSEPLSIINATSHGNATASNNTIRFTPSRNFCGSDTLTYRICNANGCDTATVFITVTCDSIGETRKPIAVNDIVFGRRNTPWNIDILRNDTLFGDLVRLEIIDNQVHGQAFVNNANLIAYAPTTDYCGNDTLRYRVCTAVGCDTAMLRIIITCDTITDFRKPRAMNDTVTVRKNNTLTFNALWNDSVYIRLNAFNLIRGGQARHGNAIVTDSNQIVYTPALNYCGMDTLIYKICNDNGCDTARICISVTCDSIINNRRPMAVADNTTVLRSNNLVINVLQNDSTYGDLVAPVIIGQGARHGVASVINNQISYTANNGFCGNDTLLYTICNANGCDSALVSVRVTCDTVVNNLRPDAIDDIFAISRNNNLIINVLQNDIPNGNLVAPVGMIETARHGITSVNNNQISYTPTTDYCGNDTLSYAICNVNGCDTAFVYINVTCDTINPNRRPNAVDDNVTVTRNNSLEINALRNDSIYGAFTSFTILDTVRHGRAVVTNDRIFYTPSRNYCGNDTLSYKICNSTGCDTAFVFVSVTCDTIVPNRRPEARADIATTSRNNSLNINILRNDSLNGTLTNLAILDSTRRGTIVIANNQVQYVPLNGFCGNDTFTYKICNAIGCDTAMVLITINCDTAVNRRPDANDDNVVAQRNTPLEINVLRNDSLYSVKTNFGIAKAPRFGRVVADSTRLFYAPFAEYCGLDTIEYFVCNLYGCDTATVFIRVNCDTVTVLRPEANDDRITTSRNTLLIINALANDSTHGTLTATLRIPQLPRHGAVVVNANNTINYTPSIGYCGNDTLQYEICNAIGCDSAFAYIMITCDTVTNSLFPIANPDFAFGIMRNSLSINLLRNDTIRGNRDSFLLTQLPNHGRAVTGADGILVYAPDSTFCGRDTMIYKLCNQFGCDTAMIVATIACDTIRPCSVAPIAMVDGININQGQSSQIFVLQNDSLKNCSLDSFYILIPAQHGSVSADIVDKVIQYTPLPDYCGKDSLVYRICNRNGCDTAVVYINIGCDSVVNNNLLPIANRDDIYGVRGIPLAIMVLRNDTTNGRVTLTLERQASAGRTQVVFGNLIQYTPSNLFCGTDTIIYKICNANGCDTGLVVVHISCDTTAACSVPPVAEWDVASTRKGSRINILVIANDSLKNCRPDSFTISRRPLHGTATTDILTQTIKYQPDTTYCGTDTLVYKLCTQAGCDTAFVIIQIQCDSNTILPRPIAIRDDITAIKDSILNLYVVRNDTLNGTLDSFRVTQQPNHGQVFVAGVDFITYQPNAGYCGLDTLIYQICNQNGCDTALVVINISCDTTRPCSVPPLAIFDTTSTQKGIAITIMVMRNDSLRNCTADSMRVERQPAHGRTTVDFATQSIVYQPDTSYCGIDSFYYSLCNRVGCDTALVIVNINCPRDSSRLSPIALRDDANGILNTLVPINVLRNDTLNGRLDSLVISEVPRHGRASRSVVTNAIYYQPDSAFCGRDSFVYKICNQNGCDTALVVINISCDTTRPCSEPPVALNDTARTPINRAVEIRAIANDSLKNCPLDSLTITRRPLHGMVQVDSIDKIITYEPLPNYCGRDTFKYQICNIMGCDTATVIVFISCDTTGLPIANNDTLRVPTDSTFIFSALANDSINGVLRTLRIIKDTGHGTATVTADGMISYRPAATYCGRDSLTYELCNQNGCDTAKVFFKVTCGNMLVIYTGFSPNYDGKNDFLMIDGIENYPNHDVRIYNRWGTEVFQTNSYRNHYSGGFEGKWNGKDLPDGVYFIRIDNGKTGIDHQIITKYIMLKR